ncbi:hypothetical protein D3C79_692090 [compost metagenome]
MAAHGGAAHQPVGLLLVQPLMAHQPPLGLLDQPPLLQLLAQLGFGLRQRLHHGQLTAGQPQPLLDRLPLATRMRHQQHPLLQQGDLGLCAESLAKQQARHPGPEREAEPHLGTELATADEQGIPLPVRGQQLAAVQDLRPMAVVADQQGQAVGLTRLVGVDQQAGRGAGRAPGGKSGHGAPCQRLAQLVCRCLFTADDAT